MRVLSMQSWDYDRGIDRVRDVARAMPDDEFVIAGRPNDTLLWPENAQVVGVINPADILPVADVVLRLTRRNDPWGRDIVEALSMGVPVVATGIWQGYVQHGVNGFLLGEYNLEKTIHYVQKTEGLSFVPDTRFHGAVIAKQIEGIYESLISN